MLPRFTKIYYWPLCSILLLATPAAAGNRIQLNTIGPQNGMVNVDPSMDGVNFSFKAPVSVARAKATIGETCVMSVQKSGKIIQKKIKRDLKATVSIDQSAMVVRVSPKGGFQPRCVYKVTLKKVVSAADRRIKAADCKLSFTTGDSPVIDPEPSDPDPTTTTTTSTTTSTTTTSTTSTTTSTTLPPPPPSNLWSDPETWNGAVPQNGSDVTIPAGKVVILDQDTPNLGGLTINGELHFAEQDLALTAKWIVVHGTLKIGDIDARYTSNAVITLTDTNTGTNIMGMGTRGIFVMGGKLLLYGNPPQTTWTKISQTAAAGATQLSLSTPVDWKAGDEIVVAPTSYYRSSTTHATTLVSNYNNQISFSTPIAYARWGKLQYVSSGGMSLTPTNFIPSSPNFPDSLDERAEVGNLTRNIKIQAPNDSLWQTQGFGAHVMVMDLSSLVNIDGVEFVRVGQAGILGRYPFHWHMLSYSPSTGQYLGDTVGHYIANSAIHDSSNRCITIHGTCGTLVDNNVCYNIKGHGIFLEDGVERRNTISNNLVLHVRNPAANKRLLVHDGDSSGYWMSNPDNTYTGNAAADNEGFGFWLAFSDKIFGASQRVAMRPTDIKLRLFKDNVTHSNRLSGIMLDNVVIDSAGNTYPMAYIPTANELPNNFENDIGATFSRVTTYKNQGQGIWNRGRRLRFEEFVNADNEEKFFAGGGNVGKITRSLAVGYSLNSYDAPQIAPVAFASYHSEFDIIANVAVNFPLVNGKQSGVFATDDYYTMPVDKGTSRNAGNIIVNSTTGYREPPHLSENWTLAGALWDPWGYVGAVNNYWVYDTPFLSEGATCTQVPPAGNNGLSCSGPYYGLLNYKTDYDNDPWAFYSPIDVTRYDSNLQPIGEWTVGDGLLAPKLGGMRHFAARPNSIYKLEFPGRPLPISFNATVVNASDANDNFILGVSFNGNVANPDVVAYSSGDPSGSTNESYRRHYTSVSSFSQLRASSGNTFYFDRNNNTMWISYRGGLEFNPWQDALYNPAWIRIE